MAFNKKVLAMRPIHVLDCCKEMGWHMCKCA